MRLQKGGQRQLETWELGAGGVEVHASKERRARGESRGTRRGAVPLAPGHETRRVPHLRRLLPLEANYCTAGP